MRIVLFLLIFISTLVQVSAQVLVKDINVGAWNSLPTNFCQLSSYTYFIANDASNGDELWRTDGTGANTNMVIDLNPGSSSGLYQPPVCIPYCGGQRSNMTAVGNELYFFGNNGNGRFDLWKTNGVDTGTMLVKNMDSLNNPNQSMLAFGNKLVFTAYNQLNGRELWISDGTSIGTHILKDIQSSSQSSAPKILFAYGSKFYFVASDTLNYSNLYASDGTDSGTIIIAGQQQGIRATPNAISFNGYIYFGSYNFNSIQGFMQLCKIDTTNYTISVVKDSIQNQIFNLASVAEKIFFITSYASGAAYCWITNGTQSGNMFLDSISPGPSNGQSSPTSFDGKIYFVAPNSNGWRLYETNGTTDGTHILFNSASTNYFPFVPQVIDNRMFFTATTSNFGNELWATDGSEVGTYMLNDICSGSCSGAPRQLFSNGSVLFFSADDGVHGYELWKVEPTQTSNSSIEPYSKVFIYPNPAENIIQLKADYGQSGLVSIYSFDGRQLFSEVSDIFRSIDISYLAKGIYTLTYQNEYGFWSNKFVKQ